MANPRNTRAHTRLLHEQYAPCTEALGQAFEFQGYSCVSAFSLQPFQVLSDIEPGHKGKMFQGVPLSASHPSPGSSHLQLPESVGDKLLMDLSPRC
jgi:hypothetical protein